MAVGTGIICIGRVNTFVRSNERICSPTVAGLLNVWPVSAQGIYGKGRGGNHPNIPERNSGEFINWDKIFQADAGNTNLTLRACSGFSALAYSKIKNISTYSLISNGQFDSGINQYRFYNFIKRKTENAYGVQDAVQDQDITPYEQGYGKFIQKEVELDVYSVACYDDQKKETSLTGIFLVPAFPSAVMSSWYPINFNITDANYGSWRPVLLDISTDNYFSQYAAPDPAYDGFMPGEETYKRDINSKHHWTWRSNAERSFWFNQ